jgi:hypothetical protein
MMASQTSSHAPRVSLFGSTYVPSLMLVTRVAAYMSAALRLVNPEPVDGSERHRRRRLPAASRSSMMTK